jgi:hypothetical protein
MESCQEIITIDDKNFSVLKGEFPRIFIDEFCNLKLYADLAEYERYAGLLNDISVIFEQSKSLVFLDCSHGGYLPIKCADSYDNIYVDFSLENEEEHKKNFIYNSSLHISPSLDKEKTSVLVYMGDSPVDLRPYAEPIIFTTIQTQLTNYTNYRLSKSNMVLCIPEKYKENFIREFHYYICDGMLNYDNLIHLSMIVKNSGPTFEDFLVKNFNNFDRWTILDTGSTDDTMKIIEKVLVGKKKGNLYQEPFINFRESRNRALELSKNSCKYILILDDTYIIEGNFRELMETIRSDQFATSYSLYIESKDNQYTSNRIIKSYKNLKYIYKIHETIQPENNERLVILPINRVKILDISSEYMDKRTRDRKYLDLKLLQEMIDEEPDQPRHLHYMAGTYNCLEDFEKCYEYHMKRINHPVEGFFQEKLDSYFEAARTAQYKLNKPWEECLKLYLKAYELDKTRPDSLYFIGIHYLNENNKLLAFRYFKHAFELGYPLHSQYSLKPTLSFYFLPKIIVALCYDFKDYVLGLKACELFLEHYSNPLCTNAEPNSDFCYKNMVSWHNIFLYLTKMQKNSSLQVGQKKLICFVADGGFSTWTGRDILNKGVGGSETFIIEIARYIKKNTNFDVIVFCNCEHKDIFEDVHYLPLSEFFVYIGSVSIHTCFISRYSEYIPVALAGNTENVYFIVHDLTPSGNIIPIHPKLKQVFCLTEWHVEYFTEIFPELKSITSVFNYGIDFNLFKSTEPVKKIPYRFIYSSFPNRGLLPLLQMWPKILERIPEATLAIHSDINGKWVNEVEPSQMMEIKRLLNLYLSGDKAHTIYYYGWSDKKTLADSWLVSDIWFYPCIFKETFCLTALEAALTKTLAITTDLAALKNTVADRGVLIPIDDSSWQTNALDILFSIKDEKTILINKNFEWASKMSWEDRAKWFVEKFMN